MINTGLSVISELEYARRTSGLVQTNKYLLWKKDLELTLLENIRGMTDIDYYYDSDHNVVDYVIYLKQELDSSYYTGDVK